MKNAMKKLMSLVLVAMILVSAVPFAASAAAGDPVHVAIYQKQADGSDFKAEIDHPVAGERVAISEICAAYGISAEDFEGAWCTPEGGKEYKKGFGDDIPAGSTLKIRKTAVEAVVDEPVVDEPVVDEPVVDEPVVDEPVVEQEPAAAVQPIKIVVKVGSSENVVWSGEKEPANGEYATVENLLNYCWNSSWSGAYTYDHGWSTKQQSNVGLTAKIYAGDTLSVMLQEKKAASSNSNTNNDDDDDNTINVNTGSTSNQATGYTKFAYPVYLNIYTDTTVGTAKKTINITSGIAADGRLTLNEVKSLVFNYYKANSSAGIQFDGLYPAQGNWVYDYAVDQKYDTIEGLYDAAANNYVYINVMITNATAITSSSNADSSNPKTGDEIYMAVTGMAVAASALALCFFFTKKRAVQ